MDFQTKVNAFVEASLPGLVADLRTLVAIPSIEGEPSANAPFGHSVARALDTTLIMADRMGLDAHNVDGYFGYADLKGLSKTQIAAITHLDVVPQGNGWTSDPFEMQIKDGYLIGRGVGDDKGPAVLTLYMAKFFLEQGKPLPYTLRIMFGTNEESGMEGLRYYQERYEDPAFCFTPDGSFPACNGEKGIFSGNFISAPIHGRIADLYGGVAGNVIPDRAGALVTADFDALQETETIRLERHGDQVRISAFGVGGHAAMPTGTVNAIGLVVQYLLDNQLFDESELPLLTLLKKIHASTDGSSLGIAADDGKFSPLTCIGGTISMHAGVVTQSINVRFPTNITPEEITQKLAAEAAFVNATFAADRADLPFYTAPDTPAVSTLVNVYNQITGRNEKPFTIGGGTYARHFKNAVSYGIDDAAVKHPAWVGHAHGADEGVSIVQLREALKIYIHAVARLMALPEEQLRQT